MTFVFYVKNKIENPLLTFVDADFILEALRIHKPFEHLYVSEDKFISILRILVDWRECFDTLDFSKLPNYKWGTKEIYDPSLKSILDDYISNMEKILANFNWKKSEMRVNIY